jgi:pimeloyl-ACP methyl ester carboxylesterase
MPDFERGTVEANGLQFHYLAAGNGPLALCVHGFPDSPWTYRYLLPELARAGYRAVAPFNRGFAPTELPADRHHVHSSTMVADALALGEALAGGQEAVLIAHDWGAVAAWGAAGKRPELWAHCVILNIPPFAIFGENIVTYDQIKRSFYFWYFQLQHVVEASLSADASRSSTASGATGRRGTTRAKTCRWSRTASGTRATSRRRSAITGASSTRPGSARPSGPTSSWPRGAATTCKRRRCISTAPTTAATA